MNRRDLFRSTLAAVMARLVAGPARAQSIAPGGLKAGFAEEDITPSIGMEKPGGYGKSYIESIHDPCKVRASVFDDGKNKAAIVGLDALTSPAYVVNAAREKIAKQCGMDPHSVMIGASHSHSSGPIGMFRRGDYDHASEFIQKLAYEHSTVDDTAYSAKVIDAIANAVCRAHDTRTPLNIGVGKGYADGVAFNRRFRMKNGQTWTHPGQGNPDIVRPAGPTDPEVGVVGAWDAQGALKGCIVNFACHGTASGPGASANWIYYMEQVIRGVFGADVVVVFTAGFSGDVTQVDNLSPYARATGDQQSRFVGGNVGAEAVRALFSMHPGAVGPVVSKYEILRIPRRKPSPENVKKAMELVRRKPEDVGVTEWTFAKETVMLDALIQKEPVVSAEVHAIQIGPAVFCGEGGEIFCEYGLRLKRASPFLFTFPVSFANTSVGYIPTERALGASGGGYEARLTSYTNLIPSAGTQMTDALIAIVASLQPGAVPEPPAAPPFGTDAPGSGRAWTYGNLPPQLQ